MSWEWLGVLPQYLLPKRLLTQLLGALARRPLGRITSWAIRHFIAHYQVDMQESSQEMAEFSTFNAFFTRALKPNCRPLCEKKFLACPVDGRMSQRGSIEHDSIIQAKGHHYRVIDLLAGDRPLAEAFSGGSFATLYLSPRDYHRVHMPITGTLREMIYVPGTLFSVNPLTARNIPNLFARNERVISIFDTAIGPMAHILVGATIVGSMQTVWHGVVNPPRRRDVHKIIYPAATRPSVQRGAEMGRFLLGSTVVLLFVKDALNWSEAPVPGDTLSMGQALANIRTTP